ncbi:hypothetical protein AURDEDRAFT_103528 [Auricularia subglabra TFB-10046 SS5]|nr:hypothetical protein AURDEDRAFT_103528 [Auricularia subglabra TFB-10046 SS5]
MTLMRNFLDARSKDPKRARPKDTFFVVLKGSVLYLYEDEAMAECWAALDVSMHRVSIYPDGLLDGELFAKRNAICLSPQDATPREMPSVTKEMASGNAAEDAKEGTTKPHELAALDEAAANREAAREEAFDPRTPWFIFVRSNVEMEDWYFSLLHCAEPHDPHPPSVAPVFGLSDMAALVQTLDAVEDRIPMRWLNALLARLFFSYYRTATLESYIIGRLMKKLGKVKRPAFLQDIVVTDVSVGRVAPTLHKPMLKELTAEGDASFEVGLRYKGEIRITIETVAIINLGARFKSYTVKLVLAAVLRELEGNLLVKVKRPPSNRIWYAFTSMPKMDLGVEPIVSDRQIKWSMILNTIESKLKEIIQESVVMPNMDDIAFFDSHPYERRGGIWEDAIRPALRPQRTPPTGDTQELADTQPRPSVNQNQEIEVSGTDTPVPMIPDVVPKAASVDAFFITPASPPLDNSAAASPLPPSPEPASLPRAETSPAAPMTAASAPNTPLKKAWFSGTSTPNNNASTSTLRTASGGSSVSGVLGADFEDEARGRALESGAKTERGSSAPAPAAPRTDDERDDEEYDHDSLAPGHGQRTHRQSSGSVSSVSMASESGSRPSTPSSSAPKGTSTFLSNLKARAAAAEKGPLATSAREAMKKWGANWGAKKEDREREDGAGGTFERERTSSTVNSNSSSSSVLNMMRSRYDEVREAVANRQREQGRTVTPSADAQAFPVDIPPRQHSQQQPLQRTVSGGSSASPGLSGISLARPGVAVASGAPPAVSAVHVAPFGLPDEEPVSPSQPIQRQPPKAATMIIPGIHQSHRNEPMAFGSPAPPPPQPQERPLSVYKLFGRLPSSQQQAGTGTITAAEASLLDMSIPTAALPPAAPSAHPPPLPPRKNTGSSSRRDSLPPLPTEEHEEQTPIPTPTPRPEAEAATQVSSSPNLSSSPASEALKNVVALDEKRRNSGSRTHSRQSSFQSPQLESREVAPAAAPDVPSQSDPLGVASPPPPPPPESALRRPPPLPPRTNTAGSVAVGDT